MALSWWSAATDCPKKRISLFKYSLRDTSDSRGDPSCDFGANGCLEILITVFIRKIRFFRDGWEYFESLFKDDDLMIFQVIQIQTTIIAIPTIIPVFLCVMPNFRLPKQ